MNSRLIPLIVILLFAATALLIQRNERRFTADEGRLEVFEDFANDTVVLRWSDPVMAPMGRRFEEAYDDYRDDVAVFVIELDSPGGALAEGKRVIQLLDRMKRSHTLVTRVRPGDSCLSMCVPMFLKGDRRVAAPNSRFMFHEPASYDSYTGRRAREPEFERRFVADRFFDRYFENSPMDADWRRQLEREWVGKDVWKSGRDLVNERSGVLTELELR
ncbi:MAG: hypothetical protein AAFW81_02685 [Pseudomonadota bacterium]